MTFSLIIVAALTTAVASTQVANHCDSLPAMQCIPLWPGIAPNETDVPPTPNETRTADDGKGCGVERNEICDHIRDVSAPSLTPFLVTNGTGAAIIIAPGGGYHDLAWSKEGIDVAHTKRKRRVANQARGVHSSASKIRFAKISCVRMGATTTPHQQYQSTSTSPIFSSRTHHQYLFELVPGHQIKAR